MSKEIIILTVSMGNDGAGRVLSELTDEWIRQGCKVTVIQTGADNYGVRYSLDNNTEIVNISAPSSFKFVRYIKETAKIVSFLKKRPDATVVAFIVASIFICGVASLFVKNRIVVSERNNPKEVPAGKLQQKLRDWAFCRADVCVFQTEDAMSLFPEKARKKGVVISNPINPVLPEPFAGERRKAIVAACRLHPQKNLPMLLEAFSMLHKDYPEYVLEIYGQGNERCRLETLADDLGVGENVFMPGFADDIHSKMLDAAMYVSSSDYEGISNSMLEALGMGVPAVVTDCPMGGARMMVTNDVNGLLVPVGNPYAMYSAMKRVIEEDGLAERLSFEARRVRELLPVDLIAQKWLEVL